MQAQADLTAGREAGRLRCDANRVGGRRLRKKEKQAFAQDTAAAVEHRQLVHTLGKTVPKVRLMVTRAHAERVATPYTAVVHQHVAQQAVTVRCRATDAEAQRIVQRRGKLQHAPL